uniref:Uncharacterized protein n=1 Tax=Castor canadensis TaxID=51338 RepID=A0A8C0XJ68_CASCN
MAGGKAGKDSRKAKTKALCCSWKAEALGLAADASKDLKVKHIAPCHLSHSTSPGDQQLDCLIKATVAGGGHPHIHKSLIGKKGQQKTVCRMPRFPIISGF